MLATAPTVLHQDSNKYQRIISSFRKILSDGTNLGTYRKHLARVKTSGKKQTVFYFYCLFLIISYKITIWPESPRSSPQSSGRLQNGNSTIKTNLIITFYCKIIKNKYNNIYTAACCYHYPYICKGLIYQLVVDKK